MPKDKKSKTSKTAKGEKKPLFSDRQKKVFLVVILGLFVFVWVWGVLRCRAACMKRKTSVPAANMAPYPEIACKFECPWPWETK